jgi:hypothetical protein
VANIWVHLHLRDVGAALAVSGVGLASDFMIARSGNLIFGSAFTERMRINAAGLVGIGTSAPSAELQVNKASDVTLALSNSTAVTSGNRGSWACYNSDSSTVALIKATAVTDNVGTQLEFYTRPAAGSLAQTMTIASTGNVGIGTSAPLAKLQTTTAGSAANEVGLRLNNPNGNVAPTGVDIVLQTGYTTGVDGAAVIRGGRNTAGTDSYITFQTNSGSGLAEVGRWLPTGGLTFNGDTAAANALDDYEEGTWTMGVSFGGASVGVTYCQHGNLYQDRPAGNGEWVS